MNLPSVTQIAREQARFVRYQEGKLWYEIIWNGSVDPTVTHTHIFQFPVPVDDAGDGSFGYIEKGITLLRWARKHVEFLQGALDDRG